MKPSTKKIRAQTTLNKSFYDLRLVKVDKKTQEVTIDFRKDGIPQQRFEIMEGDNILFLENPLMSEL